MFRVLPQFLALDDFDADVLERSAGDAKGPYRIIQGLGFRV